MKETIKASNVVSLTPMESQFHKKYLKICDLKGQYRHDQQGMESEC